MAVSVGGAKRPGVLGRVFLTLFFGVFLAAGLAFMGFIIPGVWNNAATHAWREVPCTILESRIVDADTVEGGSAGWYVRYAYVLDGREYQATIVRLDAPAGDAHDDLRRSQQLTPGTAALCFVNPRDPTQAVLERQSLAILFTPLFPLVFIVIGAGGIWFAWRRAPEKPAASGLTSRVEVRAKNERRGLVAGMLFGGVFLIVGVALTWMLFIQPLGRSLAARDWLEVPCEIVASEVVSHDSDDGTTYSVEMTYRYMVDGRVYLSNRYRFLGGSSSGYAAKARVVERHPAGSPALCFVNPEDPTDAVFDRSWSGAMWFGLIPLLFALVGGGLLTAMVRKWRVPVSALTNGPATAGRWIQRTGTASAPEVRAPGDTGGGPVVLEPRASRRMKIIGLILFAVVWNGIVSIFLVQLFGGDGGGFNWFLALFLTPFVAIGLGVIGAVVHGFLGLSNPVPRITVNTRTPVTGGTLELQWELLGRASKLSQLRVSLEGREEATYRRGTDTRTDREVFAAMNVIETRDPHAMAAGRAVLHLPERLMHSFESKNNKIVWALRVKGEIPRWPDIDDEFVITISPGARRIGVTPP